VGFSMIGKRMNNANPRILLRSCWQTVNIGDIAHAPGVLALLERYLPRAEVTLWPNPLTPAVEAQLKTRFPALQIASSAQSQADALEWCDLFLHGSGTELAGAVEAARAREAGKQYGFAGVTLRDEELVEHAELLSDAAFVFCRDTDSLAALRTSGISGPVIDFGPDSTFALDLRDDLAAEKLLKGRALAEGEFLCVVPRLRYTPYWEIFPENVPFHPDRDGVNRKYAEQDHRKLREAIIAWARSTGMRVLLVPEMTYQVSRLRPLLYDWLPEDVKPHVEVLDRFWLTAEAAAVYARAAAVLSLEMHSPIIAVSAGTPAVHVRQPTDTRKGQMWRDVGLESWLFEIDQSIGEEIADRIVDIGLDPDAARTTARNAHALSHERMRRMVETMQDSD
jgi:polysaccharide pyruvyl transferase WcaK-like protein